MKVISSESRGVATGSYLMENEHNTVLAHATNTITSAAGGETEPATYTLSLLALADLAALAPCGGYSSLSPCMPVV